ncbi:MAG: ribonuclease H-like domain-containing protein [Bacteroidia bacterium]
MYNQEQLQNILFLDIETAGNTAKYDELSERMQALWNKKAKRYARDYDEFDPVQIYEDKAAIHAEFGRVVCVSCGYLRFGENGAAPELRMRSFWGEDEVKLLTEFADTLNKFCSRPGRWVCAHNGKEFDFPYLGRRYLINNLEVPFVLQVQGKKPWETSFIDTMEMWKFGDFKSYTSLETLAAVFDIPTSKDDIDGSQVSSAYYAGEVDRIKVYCEKDVSVTAQVMLRMCGLPSALAE